MDFNTKAADVSIGGLTIMAALTLGAFLSRRRHSGVMETRLFIALFMTSLMYFNRILDATLGSIPSISLISDLTQILVPLAIALSVEGILRRHLPFFFKVSITAGTLGLIGVRLIEPSSTIVLWGSGLLFGLTMMTSIILLLMRNRDEYASTENNLIDSLFAANVITLPLVLIDLIPSLHELSPVRPGPLACLFTILCFIKCVSGDTSLKAILLEMLACVIASTTFTLGTTLIFGFADSDKFQTLFLVYLAMIAVYRIACLIGTSMKQERTSSFLSWLRRAALDDSSAFLNSIRSFHKMSDCVHLDSRQLALYDAPAIARILTQHDILSLDQIGRMKRSQPDHRLGLEQIEHILNSNKLSHVCLVRDNQSLFLFRYPSIGHSEIHSNEILVIQKLIGLMDKRKGDIH